MNDISIGYQPHQVSVQQPNDPSASPGGTGTSSIRLTNYSSFDALGMLDQKKESSGNTPANKTDHLGANTNLKTADAESAANALSGFGGNQMAMLMDEMFEVMLQVKQNQKQERTEAYRAAVTSEIAAADQAKADQDAKAEEDFKSAMASSIGQIASGAVGLAGLGMSAYRSYQANAVASEPPSAFKDAEAGGTTPFDEATAGRANVSGEEEGVEMTTYQDRSVREPAEEPEARTDQHGPDADRASDRAADQARDKRVADLQASAKRWMDGSQAASQMVGGAGGAIAAVYKNDADHEGSTITQDQLNQNLAATQASQDYDATRDAQSGLDDLLSKLSAIQQSNQQALSQITER